MTTFDPTVFPCGRGNLPGTQGPGPQGNEPTVTAPVLVAVPPLPPNPPIIPPQIPGQTTSDPPGPGTGAPGTGAPGTGVPGATTSSPGGGGFRCQEFRFICPEDLELPLPEQRVRNLTRTCVPIDPNDPNAAAGIVTSGNLGNEGYLVIFGNTLFATEEECKQNCVPAAESFSVTCDGQSSTTEPTGQSQVSNTEPTSENLDPVAQSVQLQDSQQAANGNVITVTPIIEDEDWRNTARGFTEPSLFDPDLNFFRAIPNSQFNVTRNVSYPRIFKNEIPTEVAETLDIVNTDEAWNEITLQNLTDDKIAASLQPNVLNAFQYLRYSGGEPVGLPTLLNVIRKHILEGTLDEFDVEYFVSVAEGQLDQKFDVLETPQEGENADRLALNYLKNNLHTYETNKKSVWRNFQINRVRPLNEDVNHELNILTSDGTRKDITIPNDGFGLTKLSPLSQVTLPALGSPDKLNIGDGGGYYVRATDKDSEGVAVYTDNIISKAFFAPPPVRMKVLKMLDVDPAIKITASSLENKHEFVSGDAGASEIKPLFFVLDLSSIQGDYVSDSLVESYSGSYVQINSAEDIEKHLNNNALNTPMLSLDYRDPLYRYILDTSSFTASLKDFNLVGFKEKGLLSVDARFVRNIPFGFVVTPVAGGKYNPFNNKSTLDKTGGIHVRSLDLIPATDLSIDSNATTVFEAYNLNLVDGVDRVGVGEQASNQNIGYQYSEEDFTETFFSGSYGASSPLSGPQGAAYMLTEVIDYLSDTYSSTTLTWFDVFSRMPAKKFGEMFYDNSSEFMLSVANGFRDNIKIENIEAGFDNSSRIIPEDSKSIITVADRRNVTRSRL